MSDERDYPNDDGFNDFGFDIHGFDRDGFDWQGYNSINIDRNGIKRD